MNEQNGSTLTDEQREAAQKWALDWRFPENTRVRYIPGHAHGDANHPDCEDGFVSSCSHKYVFVRYGGRQHGIATDPEDLVRWGK
jgi:hypothetical protein